MACSDFTVRCSQYDWLPQQQLCFWFCSCCFEFICKRSCFKFKCL